MPKSDLRFEENPFLHLGYAVNSYFDIIWQLIVMIGLICCISVPLMLSFADYTALENQPGYYLNKFAFGNVGGANVFCA